MKKFLICLVLCIILLAISVNAQLSYWSFDNSADPGNDDNNGNDGILYNGAVWTPNGLNNGAMDFDGLDDYVDCGNNANLNMGTNDFSVSFWFKKKVPNDIYQSFLYKALANQRAPGYGFLIRETSGNIKFTIGDGTNTIQVTTGSYNYRDTIWHHVVGLRGGGKIKLYVDTLFMGETPDTVGSVDNTDNFVIGKGGYGNNPGGPAVSPYFRGYIDEVEVFTRALSDAEITQMYQDGLAGYKNPPSVSLNLPADEATGISSSTALDVSVTDLDGDNIDVSFYGGNTIGLSENFTIIVIPDTQYYAQYMPDRFTAQTQWIVDNINNLNTVFVTHEGDIVEHGDNLTEWDRANQSMSLLDGVIPYGVLPGNHDFVGWDTTNYNIYFPYTRYEKYSWYGGHYGTDNDNNYQLFSAAGMDFIIVHLEYTPGPPALAWANQVLTNHSNRRAIVTSHSVVNRDGSWTSPGASIFNALKDNPNLFLILGGHVPGEGRRTDVVSGNTIHSLLADYQMMGSPRNGEGYLRIMTFVPKENKIYVRTYSPVLNRYMISASSHFELDYPMVSYNHLGTQTRLSSGSFATQTWYGLIPGSSHYWYVDVVDANSMTATSKVWSFITSGQPPVDLEGAWRFVVLGDTRTDHAAHAEVVEGIVNKVPNHERITIFNSGDITQDGIDSQWQTWQGIIAPLSIDWSNTAPPEYIGAIGNHDVNQVGWESRWANYLPSQVGLSAYPGITAHAQGLYGSVKYNNTIWVWIDSCTPLEGKENFLNATLLRATQDPDVEWKFVFFHYPPIPCGAKSDWNPGKTWHDNYFVPYGVDIVFLGHAHYYERTCPFLSASTKQCDDNNRGNNISNSRGVIHIITGGGGAPLHDVGNCSWVEAKAKLHHFVEVEINRSKLRLKTWETDTAGGENPVLIDDFTIDKSSRDPDLTLDGEVDIFDLIIVASNFGRTSGFDLRADADNNGEVDILDIVFIASRFT
ncbi:hypothetical protein AYK26_01715 [Euryarchaeota archaeon SM23-78]|nr:MAG: hypothetical protein AYK26_01715 [Euryarchaeota archaeon SM23-78]MBW3000496.1 metallophosphoesterase [Candidatus Woesearchaeota archaeon]